MSMIADRAEVFLAGNIAETLELVGQASQEYIRGTVGDLYPPASTPLTPPHYRTGALQDGVHYVTDESADKVSIISQRVESVGTQGGKVTSVAFDMVPVYLEFGTRKMTARPYMTPAMLMTYKICDAAVKAGMSAESTKGGGGVYAYSKPFTGSYKGI